MTDLLWQGLTISVMGMGLTFAVLVVLIVTVTLLKRVFPGQVQPSVSHESNETEPATEEEIAAAIAVALLYLRAADSHPGNLGATLEAGPGPWWRAGRMQ